MPATFRYWENWEKEVLLNLLSPKQNRQERAEGIKIAKRHLPHRTEHAIRLKSHDLKLGVPSLRWHPEENAILEEAAGLPIAMVIARVNKWRMGRQYIPRGYKSIVSRIEAIGFSAKLSSDRYLNQQQLSECLGVSNRTIADWTKFYGIPCKSSGAGGQKIYDCRSLRLKIKEFPALLERCTPDYPWLVMVLTTNWDNWK